MLKNLINLFLFIEINLGDLDFRDLQRLMENLNAQRTITSCLHGYELNL